MKILVFTGGGLAPALNPTLYGVVAEAKACGMQVLGGMYGWQCLLEGGKIIDLTDLNASPLARKGGALLRSSRTNPFKRENAKEQIQNAISKHNIEAIIAIGGNDTLGAAGRAFAEWNLPIIGIPKTIDNDLSNTYWTPGYPTAAQQTAQYTYKIKTHAAYALSRVFLIEVLGGHAGWLTAASCLGGADLVLIPEGKPNLDHILERLGEQYRANGRFAVVVMPNQLDIEGIEAFQDPQTDEYGVKRQELVAVGLAKIIRERMDFDVKILLPGATLQSADPIKSDYETADQLGKRATQLAREKIFGQAVILEGPELKVTTAPIEKLTEKYRSFPNEFFDNQKIIPTQKFVDYLSPANISFDSDHSYEDLVQKILSS